MPEGSPSVLIIRLDAIGDALALTPLLAALRSREIPVDVVLRRTNAGVFSDRAARRIVVADFELRSSERTNLERIDRLGDELRSQRYTHALVATEDPSGYRLAAASGAPARIGFADPWGKPLKAIWSRRHLTGTVYRSAGLDRRAPHECEVLFRLGASLVGTGPPTRDVAELRPLLLDRDPPPDDRVAIQVSEKWQRIGVAFDRVVDTIRRISAGGTPRLLAAAREASYANEVAAATGLAASLFENVRPWEAAIAAARAIVTPDSGALHVAGMVGTPVVGVFPQSRAFALQVARWSPWAAPHRIVRADHDLPSRAAEALLQLLALR